MTATELPIATKLTRMIWQLRQVGLRPRSLKMSLAEYTVLRATSHYCTDGWFRGVPIRLVKGDVWN